MANSRFPSASLLAAHGVGNGSSLRAAGRASPELQNDDGFAPRFPTYSGPNEQRTE